MERQYWRDQVEIGKEDLIRYLRLSPNSILFLPISCFTVTYVPSIKFILTVSNTGAVVFLLDYTLSLNPSWVYGILNVSVRFGQGQRQH